MPGECNLPGVPDTSTWSDYSDGPKQIKSIRHCHFHCVENHVEQTAAPEPEDDEPATNFDPTYAGTVAPDTTVFLKSVDGREGSGRSFGVDQSAERSHEPLAPGATLGLLRSETLAKIGRGMRHTLKAEAVVIRGVEREDRRW